jgi:large subunit ribosomal protein L4
LQLKSVLFVLSTEQRDALLKAAANVPLVDVLPTQGANVYDILRRRTLVLTKESIAELEGRLS